MEANSGWTFDATVDSIKFYIGGDLTILTPTCSAEVVVDAQVTVSCTFAKGANTLIAGTSGPLMIDIVHGSDTVLSASTKTDLPGTPYAIYIVDPRNPALVAWSVEESVDEGGTVVLVALMGTQALSTLSSAGVLSSTAGLEFNLTTTAGASMGTTIGMLSLDQLEDEGDLYAKIFEESRVKDDIELCSSNQARRYSRVIEALRNAPGSDGANPALLVVLTPDVSDLSKTTGATVKFNVNNVNMMDVGTFDFRPQPQTLAIADAQSPTGVLAGGARGGDRLVVRLENFAIVQRSSGIVVDFGGNFIDILELRESMSSHTTITIEVPAVTKFGAFDVNIYPSDMPSNEATFEYTYINDLQPSVVTFTPFSVYNDGGYDLE
eukprot:3781433-Rhodomonas_salina.1